jgi:hypothetical protein
MGRDKPVGTPTCGNTKDLAHEPAVLAHHCRELTALAHLQNETVLRHRASGVGRLHLAKTKFSDALHKN